MSKLFCKRCGDKGEIAHGDFGKYVCLRCNLVIDSLDDLKEIEE